MSDRKWFVRCQTGCLAESMTKEQIFTAITQAVETGEIKDVDTGFITRIKEQNKGVALYFWVGTQAEYNAIETKINNCFYIVTDDSTEEDIEAAIAALTKSVETVEKRQAQQFASLWAGEITESGIDAEQVKAEGISKYNLFKLVLKDPVNATTRHIFATKEEDGSVSGSLTTPNGTYCAGITVFPAVEEFIFDYGCKDTTDYYLAEIVGIM